MVCTGAKSEKAAKQAVNKVVRQLRKRGIAVASKPLVKIQNVVASASLDGEVDLENAVYKLGKIIYAPEQFPGAVYRMDYPKVVFLIFSSGKIVSVGAKKEQEVYEAIEKFKKILQEKSLILSRRNSSQISILNKNNFG